MTTYMALATVWIAVLAAVITWALVKFIVETYDDTHK